MLVLIFLYAPIVLVMLNAFNKDEFLTHWGGFTSHWFSRRDQQPPRAPGLPQQLHDRGARPPLISVAIAVPASLWARRASERGKRALDATTYMRIVLPEIVAALSLFILFRKINFTLGMVSVVIGHVVFNSAYATVIIQARRGDHPASLRRGGRRSRCAAPAACFGG